MGRKHNGDLRSAILGEARRLLLEEGYTSLSMRRIARAVDCTATSIYLYFKNKDALFHALIDEGLERQFESLKAVRQEISDPRARIEAFSRRYLQFGQTHPEYYEIIYMIHPKHLARYPADKYRRARANLDLMARYLEEAWTGPSGTEPDFRILANVLWATLHGTVSLLIAQRFDARLDTEALIERTVRAAVDLIEDSSQTESLGWSSS